MAHMIETMFSARVTPWHKLGTVTPNALSSADALIQSGLNWKVEKRPIYHKSQNGYDVMNEEMVANVRTSDDSCLGIVTNKYKILQNEEAFAFADLLLNDGVEYESAGSLKGGKTVWMLAKLPQCEIVDDKVDPYLVITNSHDGNHAIRVAITPIRVVCQNTLNLALKGSVRQWSTRHMGDIKSKMIEASRTLELAKSYMIDLATISDNLANQTIDQQYVIDISKILFPIDDEDSDRKKDNQRDSQKDLMYRWQFAPDLTSIRDTKWGLMNAVTDSATHKTP